MELFEIYPPPPEYKTYLKEQSTLPPDYVKLRSDGHQILDGLLFCTLNNGLPYDYISNNIGDTTGGLCELYGWRCEYDNTNVGDSTISFPPLNMGPYYEFTISFSVYFDTLIMDYYYLVYSPPTAAGRSSSQIWFHYDGSFLYIDTIFNGYQLSSMIDGGYVEVLPNGFTELNISICIRQNGSEIICNSVQVAYIGAPFMVGYFGPTDQIVIRSTVDENPRTRYWVGYFMIHDRYLTRDEVRLFHTNVYQLYEPEILHCNVIPGPMWGIMATENIPNEQIIIRP